MWFSDPVEAKDLSVTLIPSAIRFRTCLAGGYIEDCGAGL